MDTENLAVSAIKLAIAKTDYLVAYINDKDREPMWDGAIYAYSSEDKNKNNKDFIGKAAVQVKGTEMDTLDVSSIKYDLLVADLENYKKDGGLLFFVVVIDKERKFKIFYKALTPFLINSILKDKKRKTQQKIRTSFMPFPEEKNEICNIVIDFIRDAKKQELLTHEEIVTLKDFLMAAGENITFELQGSGIGYKEQELYKYMLDHSLYLYVKNTILKMMYPLGYISKVDSISRKIDRHILIKGKVHYKQYEVILKKDAFTILLGKSVILNFDEKEESVGFTYKLCGNLEERIQDLQFIIDLVNNQYVQIETLNESIELKIEDRESFLMDQNKELLNQLKAIDSMMKCLGVEKVLDIDKLTKVDKGYLQMLLCVFVDKKTIKLKSKNVSWIERISIQNVHLILYFRQMEDGNYLIENYPEMEFDDKKENGEVFTVSKYAYLSVDDIIEADNIHCKEIVDDVLRYTAVEHFNTNNDILLKMIKAYDRSKKEEYITEAIRLAEWMKEKKYYEGISVINYLQCVFRITKLSEEQEEELINLLDTYHDNYLMKAAAYILLEDYKIAKKCLEKLNEEERNAFYQFPIYNLMKR